MTAMAQGLFANGKGTRGGNTGSLGDKKEGWPDLHVSAGEGQV